MIYFENDVLFSTHHRDGIHSVDNLCVDIFVE